MNEFYLIKETLEVLLKEQLHFHLNEQEHFKIILVELEQNPKQMFGDIFGARTLT